MNNADIHKYLKKYVSQELSNKDNLSRKTFNIFNEIMESSEDDVVIGKKPHYFFAYIQCNSTAVGISSFKGSETQRTVALDYNTEEYLFIDGHEGAARKGLEIYYLKPEETILYYKKENIKKIAESYGLKLHLQQFGDLNISLHNHRLNRYNVKVTKEEFTYPIHPIFCSVTCSDKPVLVGYVYEMNGQEYFSMDFEDIKNPPKKKKGCSPWMLWGLVFPPVFLVAIIVWLYRTINDPD